MAYQQHDTLWNRSFIGLLIAQFQAAFSDQAIHASGMFFAIRQQTMTEDDAISLMPILFYAPWGIFVTLAGYLSDRYSKRSTIVFWKVFEVGIVILTFIGFYLGSVVADDGQAWAKYVGSYLVLFTVFLMGSQSAFFVPAKYGVMPEIFRPHLLSRGNGLLESLSFLAIILGTVSGGVLSYVLQGQEYWIGIILIGLSVIGASASFMVERIPPANPDRPFPKNLFKPLWENLGTLLRSRPLLLAVLGIAFFTFMVAYMRAVMYMHGETRNPRWSELHTSIVVGVVALGIGLGSPLAGYLSGGKIELGLVPIGALGMIIALLTVAFTLAEEWMLVSCLVAIGFFTGFYIVPLFTQLQHRAPKKSKGDLVASSNFINVIGAISASILFKGLVVVAGLVGVIAPVATERIAMGELTSLTLEDGHPTKFSVKDAEGKLFQTKEQHEHEDGDVDRILLEAKGRMHATEEGKVGTDVEVLRYEIPREGQPVVYYRLQPQDRPEETIYNKESLTRYLFLGAAFMTMAILAMLWGLQKDLMRRSLRYLGLRKDPELDKKIMEELNED